MVVLFEGDSSTSHGQVGIEKEPVQIASGGIDVTSPAVAYHIEHLNQDG